MIVDWIENIYVHEGNKITIHFKFQNEMQKLTVSLGAAAPADGSLVAGAVLRKNPVCGLLVGSGELLQKGMDLRRQGCDAFRQ